MTHFGKKVGNNNLVELSYTKTLRAAAWTHYLRADHVCPIAHHPPPALRCSQVSELYIVTRTNCNAQSEHVLLLDSGLNCTTSPCLCRPTGGQPLPDVVLHSAPPCWHVLQTCRR